MQHDLTKLIRHHLLSEGIELISRAGCSFLRVCSGEELLGEHLHRAFLSTRLGSHRDVLYSFTSVVAEPNKKGIGVEVSNFSLDGETVNDKVA